MSDIIKDAKRLLEGVTPGPWELSSGEIHQIQHTPEQCTSIRCDHRWPVLSENWGENPGVAAEDRDLTLMAAAPELAQALAEETWEYQVQARSMKRPAWKPSTNSILQKWYGAEDIEEAKSQARMYTPYFRGREKVEIRVLRRRVSPPEVIE